MSLLCCCRRIQDLSIKASSSTSSHASDSGSESGAASSPRAPPLPAATPPLAEPEREAEQRSSPLKRKNKRASLSPTAKRKTSLSDVVVAEGELVVAEVREQRDGDAVVLRTLGSVRVRTVKRDARGALLTACSCAQIFCVLLVKNRASLHLETVSPHKHHLIELDVGAMELVGQDALQEPRKFKLQHRFSEQGRPFAYVFECATPAQYHKWIDSIVEFRARSVSPRPATSSSGSSDSITSSRTGTDLVRINELSAQRRMRSIASMYDQLPPARLQTGQAAAAAVLRSPHSSFVFAAPPKTKHVILVRHGHYINAHERGAQDSQQVLSQMGRQQAEFTGKYLEQLYARAPTRHDITIFHSDMTRAVETARAIGKDVGHCSLSATPLLREGWPGRPYSSHGSAVQTGEQPVGTRAELERLDTERMELAFQTFFTQSSASAGGGGGDDDDCEEEEQFSYQVVVCHANLIRFFLCRAMGIEPAGRWGHFEINHCGVSRVDVSEHRPLKILSVNETGHLPPSLITSSEDHL